MRLPDLEAWAIFAAVVEHRSFSAAADAIGLSKATVSKAITRLEAQLNQSLFHRTSRRLALTEAGKPLADHAARILAEARAAEEAARDAASAPSGRIRLAAPMSFGVSNIAPIIADFLAQHPGKVFTRETLLSRVWGYDYYGGARTVDVHVRRLRSKLGEEHANLIQTVRSVGYSFGTSRWV